MPSGVSIASIVARDSSIFSPATICGCPVRNARWWASFGCRYGETNGQGSGDGTDNTDEKGPWGRHTENNYDFDVSNEKVMPVQDSSGELPTARISLGR